MNGHRLMLGEWELVALSDGFFRLDGGSMFGVIPKPLWERKKPADERNRIRLGLNSLLVKTPQALVLLESGIGDKMSPKEEDLYGLERQNSLLRALEEEGCDPEDIDFVIHSHLHLDHCGWATREADGIFKPTFPRARYVVQSREWDAATNPDLRSRASYDERDFSALERKGLLAPVDGEAEILPGIRVMHTGGHTPGHQVTYFESEGARCVFLGDLVPTQAHLKVNWHMGWDLFPLELMEVKGKVLMEAVRRRDLLFFTHEDQNPFAYVEGEGGRLHIVPVDNHPPSV
ncbi:MAG: MBL fold metallo-hydrolase [Actinobacteria bacterium]|nr:MBL fold metallo-hydrolase [Actinomycetota bacterium]